MSTKRKAAEASAAGGEAVQDKIREITVKALHDRKMNPSQVGDTVREVMEGAAEGVRDAMPEEQTSTLRQVMDGVGEAVGIAMRAVESAAQDAGKRGREFVDSDAKRIRADVERMENELVSTVESFGQRLGDEVRAEWDTLVRRAKLTSNRMRGPAGSAFQAAREDPIGLTKEAASSGVKAVRNTASRLMLAGAGLLEGIGKSVSAAPARPAKKTARKPAAKKAGKKTSKTNAAKKTVKKKAAGKTAKKAPAVRKITKKTAAKAKVKKAGGRKAGTARKASKKKTSR